MDATAYASGATVTVAANTGSLEKPGYTFDGWCTTQPDAGASCGGTLRASASTFVIAADTTLYAVWTTTPCASGGVCALGDVGPGGGTVFYVADEPFTSTGSDCATECRYLEAAPQDWQTHDSVGLPAGADPTRAWATGGNNSVRMGTTGASIGAGHQNTSNVVAQAGNVAGSSAGVLARSYTGGGKTDWHLPSRGELTQLYDERDRVDGLSRSGTGITQSIYFSSTEETYCCAARAKGFGTGTEYSAGKSTLRFVRPVRAF